VIFFLPKIILFQLSAMTSMHLLMQACWPALDATGQLLCAETLTNKIPLAFGDVVFDDCRLAFLSKLLEMEHIFEHGQMTNSIVCQCFFFRRQRSFAPFHLSRHSIASESQNETLNDG
jgi:hypothetical protein